MGMVRRIARAVLGVVALGAGGAAAQDAPSKFAERAQRAAEVVAELVAVRDSAPPTALLADAACLAVVPGVKQAGLVVGGRVGYGLVSCRTASGWSAPVFIALKGGSIGLQIGGQVSDVVLVFLNRSAPAFLARSSFNLGGQASIAAGPVGRDLSAETDWRATAEILSYSRSRGLFAGLNLAGTKWEVDDGANRAVYGRAIADDPPRLEQQLRTDGAAAPRAVKPFLAALRTRVPAKR